MSRSLGSTRPTNPLRTAVPEDEITGARVDPRAPLLWRRVARMESEFELRQGEAVFGEMEPAPQPSMHATGECLGRVLDLRLVSSFLRGHRVETRISVEGREGPFYRGRRPGWGRVVTPDGEVLRWRHGFVRMYDHVLQDAERREVLRLRPAFFRFLRTETRVMVTPTGWARPDIAELILLTWFLRILAENHGRPPFGASKRRAKGDAS